MALFGSGEDKYAFLATMWRQVQSLDHLDLWIFLQIRG